MKVRSIQHRLKTLDWETPPQIGLSMASYLGSRGTQPIVAIAFLSDFE